MVIKNCIKTCTTENLQTFFISNYRFKHLKIYPPLLGKFIELNTHVYVKEHKLVFRPLEVILQKSNFLEFWSRNSHDFSILNELKDYHFLKEKKPTLVLVPTLNFVPIWKFPPSEKLAQPFQLIDFLHVACWIRDFSEPCICNNVLLMLPVLKLS